MIEGLDGPLSTRDAAVRIQDQVERAGPPHVYGHAIEILQKILNNQIQDLPADAVQNIYDALYRR